MENGGKKKKKICLNILCVGELIVSQLQSRKSRLAKSCFFYCNTFLTTADL